MKKGFDLLIKNTDIENVLIEKVYVVKRVFCSEIDIKVWMIGFINPVSYTIDCNENYKDNLLFTTDNQERRFKKIMKENDKRYLLLKTYDMLENDNCIPWLGKLIDVEIEKNKLK